MLINILIYFILTIFSFFVFISIGGVFLRFRASILESSIIGIAATSFFLGVLLFAGIPFFYSSYFLIITTAFCIGYYLISSPRLKIKSFKESLGLFVKEYGVLFIGVTLTSSLMIFWNNNSSYQDPWGSGDFFFYWSLSDYLYFFDLDASKLISNNYPISNLKEHVADPPFIRWGSFAVLSFFKTFNNNLNVYILNPLISLLIYLTMIVASKVSGFHKLNKIVYSVVISITMFNFFPLFYTYLGQSLSVLYITYYLYISYENPNGKELQKSILLCSLVYTYAIFSSFAFIVLVVQVLLSLYHKQNNHL